MWNRTSVSPRVCPGEMWVKQDTGFEMIAENTEKGRCVTCPLGKSSDVGSWECQNLPSGSIWRRIDLSAQHVL